MTPDTPNDSLYAALPSCLAQLAAGDLTARDRIIELCSDRLRTLAHRMLAGFPSVRRWEDTDDVFQNAAMRFHRSLGQMKFEEPRFVMVMAATHLHRELIDLARHHSGPTAYAANHGTNAIPGRGAHGDEHWFIDQANAPEPDLARWTLFHESIEGLPITARSFIWSGIWAPINKRSHGFSTVHRALSKVDGVKPARRSRHLWMVAHPSELSKNATRIRIVRCV